ncbi:hypothetical protein ACSW9O_15255 (plasmid) [Clostridium perfringens]|nr:hypothetical protein [Clostridium perfringens]
MKKILQDNLGEEVIYILEDNINLEGILEGIEISKNKIKIIIEGEEVIIKEIMWEMSYWDDREYSVTVCDQENIHILYIV